MEIKEEGKYIEGVISEIKSWVRVNRHPHYVDTLKYTIEGVSRIAHIPVDFLRDYHMQNNKKPEAGTSIKVVLEDELEHIFDKSNRFICTAGLQGRIVTF